MNQTTMNFSQRFKQTKEPTVYAGIFLFAGISSFFIDPYLAYVATSWVIFGLLGFSLDLMWGKGGVLSLGQTAFYGLGAYFGGVAAINFSGLTGNTLVWSLPVGLLTGTFFAALVGRLIFYGRMQPLQTTIVTYTFILILWTLSISLNFEVGDAVIGGDNGMSDVPGYILSFGEAGEILEPNAGLLVILAISSVVFFGVWFFMKSPFGLIIDAIRADESKAELLGYDIRHYRWMLFILSGGIAGLAGVLYGSWSNYLNPSIFSVQEALLIPIYVLVGGRGSLFGSFLGAFVVGGLSFWLGGGVIGGQTTLFMGVGLIFLVLFLKQGIIGGFKQWISYFSRRQQLNTENVFEKTIDYELLKEFRSSKPGILETKDVVKRFGGIIPVNRVSQVFKPGKARCLIGPNGAGKSSYLKTCTGAYSADGGKVIFENADITRQEIFSRVRSGIGIKMQKAQVFGELSVFENLWAAAYAKHRKIQDADRTVQKMLRFLGMENRSEDLAEELSHGEQQWLDIGMVISLFPKILLLDEPAAGMTREERGRLSELIRFFAEKIPVVTVEHDMDFIGTLDADVTVLHQGKLFARGDLETLRTDERVLDIYLGRRKYVQNI